MAFWGIGFFTAVVNFLQEPCAFCLLSAMQLLLLGCKADLLRDGMTSTSAAAASLAAAAAAAAAAGDLTRSRDVAEGATMRQIYKSNVMHHKITRHTSHVTSRTSHVTRHTSHVTPHTSHLTPHTSLLTLQTIFLNCTHPSKVYISRRRS